MWVFTSGTQRSSGGNCLLSSTLTQPMTRSHWVQLHADELKTNSERRRTFLWFILLFFKCSFSLCPQKPQGLLGTGSPGCPPRLSYTWGLTLCLSELQGRSKVETVLQSSGAVWELEVAVLGSPSLIVLIVSVDVKQHWTELGDQSSGAVWKPW